MTFRELLDAGDLTGAIEELNRQVKAKPADASLRVSLFELLCFEGDLERAAKQLEVIAVQKSGPAAELAAQQYRDLLDAERMRRNVFHGDALPKFLLPPPPYVEAHVLLIKKLQTSPAEGAALLTAAEEQFPALTGHAGEKAFGACRDADDRIGPVLEVFHGPNYVWLPLEQIAQLQVAEPKSARDLLWARVRVQTYEQSVGDVVVPTLYVDSHRQADQRIRLGRVTEWEMVADLLVRGMGQRVFLLDDREVPFLELRDLQFEAVAGAADHA